MAIQSHFNKFDKTIYLTNQSDDYKEAKEKDVSILDAIKIKFKENKFSVENSFLQGSFSVDTAIKSKTGDYDIDRSIVINSDTAPEDPLKPKNVILEVLENRNFQDPKVKMPCVTADYLSKNLHIDFTVYSKDQFENYKLSVGKRGSSDDLKEWSDSDPIGLKDWILSTNNYGEGSSIKRKQFKRFVRFIKRWRDVTFGEEVKKKIFSIGLTVMIKNEYKPDTWRSDVDDDLTALKRVIDNILGGAYLNLASSNPDQYRIYVPLPCSPYRDIFQHKNEIGNKESGSDKNIGTQLKNKLTTLQNKLQEAIDETDEVKQCKILNKVFGEDFKVPEKKTDNSSNSSGQKAASVFPSAGAVGTSQGAICK